jgi:hypothetical protein
VTFDSKMRSNVNRAISTTHCTTVSLAQHGEGLGAMRGVEKAREMLGDAGFRKVEVEQLPHDFANDYFVGCKAFPQGAQTATSKPVALPKRGRRVAGPRPQVQNRRPVAKTVGDGA